MADTTNNTLKNLEKALLKNGRSACPNPDCNQSIISEEKEGRAGASILEYWCENETCEYHKRRVIRISIGKGIAEQLQSGFSMLSKRAITGLVGVFLVIGATLGNYIPKFFGVEVPEDEKLEEIKEENEKLQSQIKTLLARENAGDPTPAPIDNSEKDKKITELEEEIAKLNTLIETAPICESELKVMIREAEGLMKRNDAPNAMKVFERIHDDARVRKAFLAPENNELLRKMVGRFADSYSENLKLFTYEYLKKEKSFKFFQQFLEDFPVPAKDIYLGKAFYNYPHYTDQEMNYKKSKRLQLISAKHYLMAARDNRFKLSDTHIMSAINNVLDLYKLFKYKNTTSGLPADYITIETAIENRDVLTIKKRIDELQKLIDKLPE